MTGFLNSIVAGFGIGLGLAVAGAVLRAIFHTGILS